MRTDVAVASRTRALTPKEVSVRQALAEPQWGQVSGDFVNVRSGPGTPNEVVATLRGGEFIRAYARVGPWLEIDWPESSPAWATQDFIAADGTVTADRVRIRSSGNLNASILGEAGRGAKLEILGEAGTWFKVKAPAGTKAFLYGKYAVLGVRAPEARSRFDRLADGSVAAKQSVAASTPAAEPAHPPHPRAAPGAATDASAPGARRPPVIELSAQAEGVLELEKEGQRAGGRPAAADEVLALGRLEREGLEKRAPNHPVLPPVEPSPAAPGSPVAPAHASAAALMPPGPPPVAEPARGVVALPSNQAGPASQTRLPATAVIPAPVASPVSVASPAPAASPGLEVPPALAIQVAPATFAHPATPVRRLDEDDPYGKLLLPPRGVKLPEPEPDAGAAMPTSPALQVSGETDKGLLQQSRETLVKAGQVLARTPGLIVQTSTHAYAAAKPKVVKGVTRGTGAVAGAAQGAGHFVGSNIQHGYERTKDLLSGSNATHEQAAGPEQRSSVAAPAASFSSSPDAEAPSSAGGEVSWVEGPPVPKELLGGVLSIQKPLPGLEAAPAVFEDKTASQSVPMACPSKGPSSRTASALPKPLGKAPPVERLPTPCSSRMEPQDGLAFETAEGVLDCADHRPLEGVRYQLLQDGVTTSFLIGDQAPELDFYAGRRVVVVGTTLQRGSVVGPKILHVLSIRVLD